MGLEQAPHNPFVETDTPWPFISVSRLPNMLSSSDGLGEIGGGGEGVGTGAPGMDATVVGVEGFDGDLSTFAYAGSSLRGDAFLSI